MSLERRIIFLTQTQIDRLTALAQGRSIGELVREAVDFWLDMREKGQARREER